MELKRILFIIAFFLPLVSYSQKETNIWYFGNHAGLDYSDSPPKALLNGSLNSHEGAAIMSDKEGNLLFYTNGETVWNKNHQQMENGTNLGGHSSARQPAVILPKPGAQGIYYIFTMDARENGLRNGLMYSVIDLNSNQGLGKVIGKGNQLHTPGSESLSIVGSCIDGEDRNYWVVAANYGDQGKVFAYKIDKNGINKTPVVSSFSVKGEMISYIKFSPAANKAVFVDQQLADEPHTTEKYTQIIVADFNFQSGAFYSPFYLKVNSTRHYNQAEFSPDGKRLYVSSGSKIIQLDLVNPGYPVTDIQETNMGILGDFQLAPDGNIYISTSAKFLSIIRNPNERGLQGKFNRDAVDLGGRESSLGLPGFVTSYLYNGLVVEAGDGTRICSDKPIKIGMQAQEGVSYQWHPPDYLSKSDVANPIFRFHNTGDDAREFEYILTATNEHCSKQDTVRILVYPAPPDEINGSKSVCPGVVGVEYNVPQKEYYSYHWEVIGGNITDGQGTSTILVNWGPTNPSAKVKLTSASSKGCESSMIELPVRINVKLDTETPQGPEWVCLNQRQQVSYFVPNTNGSIYTWDIEGGVITAGQKTNQIWVDWQGLGTHQIWLQERSITQDTICYGASEILDVLVYKDTTEIALDYVSLSSQDDEIAEIQGNHALGAVVSADFILYRRQWGSEAWQEIGNATKDHISFTDGPLESDNFSYEYKLVSLNPCNETITSAPHRTILLNGEINSETDQLFLEWNPYEGWRDGVEQYEIWTRIDEEESFRLLTTTDAQTLQYTATNGVESFTHHFRIKAIGNSSSYSSWSNEISLTFAHSLVIPNVFTPNGDEFNSKFEIKKLELYPDNELLIYNRWGQIVFRKKGYKNEWDGLGVAPGVYYYSLKINSTSKTYRGWIMIVNDDKY